MAGAGFGATSRQIRGLFEGGSVLGLEDGQLLGRYESSRDEAAFEALVVRHGPMVLTTCRAVLRDEHDVEDAFQATFLVLARKAGSVRGDSLGGWLHRVAYRASVQARVEASLRRRKEAEASTMARRGGSRVDPEVEALLHEEVDRLPEPQRLAVVLCDLEGLTYDQAARRLRWTASTLRNRLARARQRLRGRLSRRGLTAPAIIPAALPDSLSRPAVLAATGGPASTGASLMAHHLLRGMLMTQIKVASTAALAALLLASAGLVAAGRQDEPKPATKPAAQAEAAAPKAPAPATPTEPTEVRGRVVAPDGRPIAGAIIRAVVLGADTTEASSGPDGQFRIMVPPTKMRDRAVAASYPWIVATAPGFGAGWIRNPFEAGPSGEVTIRLVADGPPIEGRLLDLEGRPVADALVAVDVLWLAEEGQLDPWLAKVRENQIGTPAQGGLAGVPVPIEGKSGPDGRFRLAGLGRDRVATLRVSGPTVATILALVILREGTSARSAPAPPMRGIVFQPMICYPPRFELALAPTRLVEGVARDKDTGQPIAGLTIQGRGTGTPISTLEPGVSTRTDDRGLYRLVGLPKAESYGLYIDPARGQARPYPVAHLNTPAGPTGLEPIRFDFALKRGVLVTGRVTDKRTGKPVAGYVNAYTFRNNPNLADFPGSAEGPPSQDFLDADGRYRVVAIPGRAVLACRSDLGRYLGGFGAEAIPGFDAKLGSIPFAGGLFAANFHGLALVETAPGAESATLDFQLDSGGSATVTVLDPEGRPIGGTVAKGVGDLFQSTAYPQDSPTFEVNALHPSRPRRLIVTHEGRKLVGSVYLKGDESGAISIKLQPWGTVVGRVVDDEGRPRKGLGLTSTAGNRLKDPEKDGLLPNGDFSNGILLGPEGKFRIEGLIPGLRYGARAGQGNMGRGVVFEGVIVGPGEVKDLGDLTARTPGRPQE